MACNRERSWEQPPPAPAPWRVHWKEQQQAYSFQNAVLGWCVWELPLAAPSSREFPWPAVPEPWELQWDASRSSFEFWNPVLEQFCEDTVGEPVIPVFRRRVGDWEACSDAAGNVAFKNVLTAELTYQFSPPCAPGWRVKWSPSRQSWYWQHSETGELTLEPPSVKRRAAAEGEPAEADLLQALREAGHLPDGGEVSRVVLRRHHQ